MSAQNASQDSTANPSKDAPSRPERDGRKTAQDDGCTESDNKPPDHGIPTHGVGRFLWECDKRTPVSELGQLYDRWQDDSQQVDLGRWSE